MFKDMDVSRDFMRSFREVRYAYQTTARTRTRDQGYGGGFD
jgi:hypothetical protein